MNENRYLAKTIEKDLKEKMVFLCGPRQVGKTTLAKLLLGGKAGYLNWDIPEHRTAILARELPLTHFWVFDEIHKYRSWRNYLKGLYDELGKTHQILVTGSAKLDVYRYGGDSLQGRYHFLRMHPLSFGELKLETFSEFQRLLRLGGFPEPYFSNSEDFAKRWSREYRSRLITEEISSLEHVIDMGNLELLAMRLPDLVGSPLSINALREDLQVSHKTVSNWLDIFERLFLIFRLRPFGAPKIRAVKKEQKHYHFDWTLVQEQGLRFENLIASHLLKWVHYQQDVLGEDIDLCYFRDVDNREVDFVITQRLKPLYFIEVKWKDAHISPSLKYMKTRFPKVTAIQVVAECEREYQSPDGIQVLSATTFLKKWI